MAIRWLLALSSRYYRKIPLAIREPFTPVLYKYYYRVRSAFYALYPMVFVFEGQARGNGLALSFAYAGSDDATREYWSHTLLTSSFKRHSLGRCFFLRVLPVLKKKHFNCDFIFIEHLYLTLQFFGRTKGFRIPSWIKMEITLPNLDKKVWQAKKADIQRLIRKHHLEFELSRDPDRFDEFYYGMHVPYIKERFEEAALVEDPKDLRDAYARGGLLLVKKGPEVLAGVLFEYLPQKVRLRKLGVRDANWQYVRWGVISAMYYFVMLEMEKEGYEKILIGGTRPLLTDGVTRYKISVNARLLPVIGGTCLWLRLLKDTPALKDFLTRNPFVYFPKPNQPRRAIFLNVDPDFKPERIEEIVQDSACEGITGTDLFVFGEVGTLQDSIATAQNCPLTIKPARDLFVDQGGAR